MKKAWWGIVVVLGCVAVLGFVYRQQIVLRLVGMRPFVDERFGGWVAAGAPEQELDTALRRIHDPIGAGPGSWVRELSEPAARHEALAREAEAAGDLGQAAREYHTAAVLYYIARFPFVGSEAKAEAYAKHIDCYLKAVEYGGGPPIEIVRIPYEGAQIVGYLRKPAGVARPPVVVLTGGVDTWKSDIERQAQAMLDEGMAAFCFDMPGTGESAWPLAADSEHIYSRVFGYLKTRPDLDGERIGAYLQSFAGYFAVKLAVTDPNLTAAVNVGGPIAISYTLEHAKSVPQVMVRTIAHAMRENPDQPLPELVERIEAFSLEQQGLLRAPERQAALLSINGDQDPLVAIEDVYVISRKGIHQDEWVYAGDGHCAPEHAAEHVPKAAAWLKAHLAAAASPETPTPTETEASAVLEEAA